MRERYVDKDEIITAGNKLYVRCPDCHSLVRINKPIFGSLHVCAEEIRRQNDKEPDP